MGFAKEKRSYLPSSVAPEPRAHETKGNLDNPRRHLTRRRILALLLLLLPITLLLRPVASRYKPTLPPSHGKGLGSAPAPLSVEDRVRRILSETPLIDGHNDMAILVRAIYNNHIYDSNFTEPFEQGGLAGHVDIPLLREGMNGGFFWSAFVPCPEKGDDFSDENYAASVAFTLQQIDVINRLKDAYPDDFSGAVDSSNALAAFKDGQFISPLGIEGLHQIGNSVANLRLYHALGVRYATLTHNCHNKFADAAVLENPIRKAEPRWGGVSSEGRKLIREMNRMGMFVDISHTSEDTQRDILGDGAGWSGSEAPVIYSHSSAYSICPHPRNVKDDVLELVRDRNSLVMVNFNPPFISCAESDNPNGMPDYVPETATLDQVVRHIMHIGDLIGYDHVGVGSDFDGIEEVPKGLEDVSKYPDLVAELLRRGVSDEDAAKVVGGNLLRVWTDVDAVARRMQADGELPLEDDLPDVAFE